MRFASYALFSAVLESVRILAAPPDESGTIPNGTQQFSWSPDLPNGDNTGSGRDPSLFYAYDAYYNGTASFYYTSQTPTDTCSKNYTNIPAVFSVGGMTIPGSNISRSDWDANNFYFSLANVAISADPNCGDQQNGVPCDDSFQFLSSSPELYFSQGWTTNAQRSGDGYDISGNLTTIKINGDNRYDFYMPACSKYPQGVTLQADESIDVLVLTKQDGVGMTGHVSPTTATATVTVAHRFDGDSYLNATLTIAFTGAWFTKGASLITSGPYPATSGKADIITTSSSSSGSPTTNTITRYLKYIIPGIIVVAIIGFILCCCRRLRTARARRVVRPPVGNFEPHTNQGYPLQAPPQSSYAPQSQGAYKQQQEYRGQ